MTYAGRLDPMAEGMLILLAGEDCKQKDMYLDLDKTYILEVLVGVATDTHDILGIVEDGDIAKKNQITESYVKEILQSFTGIQYQAYPAYSSKTVAGKPLFSYARENLLGSIDIPGHEITLYNIELKSLQYVPIDTLVQDVLQRVDLVQGDFRQEIIKKSWHLVLESKNKDVTTITLEVNASRGAYMRQLAYDIGKKMGVPALALRIKRIKVGDYTLI